MCFQSKRIAFSILAITTLPKGLTSTLHGIYKRNCGDFPMYTSSFCKWMNGDFVYDYVIEWLPNNWRNTNILLLLAQLMHPMNSIDSGITIEQIEILYLILNFFLIQVYRVFVSCYLICHVKENKTGSPYIAHNVVPQGLMLSPSLFLLFKKDYLYISSSSNSFPSSNATCNLQTISYTFVSIHPLGHLVNMPHLYEWNLV